MLLRGDGRSFRYYLAADTSTTLKCFKRKSFKKKFRISLHTTMDGKNKIKQLVEKQFNTI